MFIVRFNLLTKLNRCGIKEVVRVFFFPFLAGGIWVFIAVRDFPFFLLLSGYKGFIIGHKVAGSLHHM